MSWWPWLLPVGAYLLGSVSFAWIAGRMNGIDLREHGSRNLGATNAGRVLGTRWFVFVFALDVLKGVAAVAAARWLVEAKVAPLPFLPIACAAGAVLGHVFTCWHRFRGGKAVATSLGVLIGLLPTVAAAGFGVWLLCWCVGWAVFRAKRSDAVGPASVLAAAAAPTIHLVTAEDPWRRGVAETVFILLLAVLVIAKHRTNIVRLLRRPAA